MRYLLLFLPILFTSIGNAYAVEVIWNKKSEIIKLLDINTIESECAQKAYSGRITNIEGKYPSVDIFVTKNNDEIEAFQLFVDEFDMVTVKNLKGLIAVNKYINVNGQECGSGAIFYPINIKLINKPLKPVEEKMTLQYCNSVSSEMNLNLPKQIDSITTAESTICTRINNSVELLYRNTVNLRDGIDNKIVIDKLYNIQKNNICTNPTLRSLVKTVDMGYIFSAENGTYIGEFSIKNEDCK